MKTKFSQRFGGGCSLLEMMLMTALLALLAVLAVPEAQAAPPAQFDFPIAAPLNGSTTSNAIVTTNSLPAPIPAGYDLSIGVTVSPATILVLRSNAVVGLDVIGGPLSAQRTTSQPIQLSVPLTATNTVTYWFWLSRTNFYGATGLAVDSYGVNDSTNVMAVTLTEVSGNWQGP